MTDRPTEFDIQEGERLAKILKDERLQEKEYTWDGSKDTTLETQQQNLINHPSHYKGKDGIEVIDVIEAFDLGFCLGNAIKYILRAGKKDNRGPFDSGWQDLKKAKWYLDREIKKEHK